MPEQAYKRCGACGSVKPTSAFHRNSTTKDGLQDRCKPCHVQGNRDRKRKGLPKRPLRESLGKNRARGAVTRAINSGRLIKSTKCENCGKEPGLDAAGESGLDAHHDDYSKPLEIKWLCSRCHIRHHRVDVEQRRRVHRMWHEGASIKAIADAAGRNSTGTISALIAKMREDGWDLPYRRQPAQAKHPELGAVHRPEERRSI